MEQTINKHLKDLRKTLILFGIPLFFLFGLFFYLSPNLINATLNILGIENAVALTPFESITTQLRFSFGLSFLILIPMIFVLTYKFMSDELEVKTKKKLLTYSIPSMFLGFLGVIFGTFVFSNFVLNFLIGSSIVEPMLSIKSIIDFTIISGISFALMFQMMVIIPLTVNSNLIKKDTLKQLRLPIFLIILIVSALITPSDLFSMFMMSIPVYGCYELGMLFSRNKKEVNKICLDSMK